MSVATVLPAVTEGSEPVMLLGRPVSVSVTAASDTSLALVSLGVVCCAAGGVVASKPLSALAAAAAVASPPGPSGGVDESVGAGVAFSAAVDAAPEDPQ